MHHDKVYLRRLEPTPMQSGKGEQGWGLRYVRNHPVAVDPLTGWQGGSDVMRTQLRLSFESKEAALDYAERLGLRVIEPAVQGSKTGQIIQERARPYAGNFRHDRRFPWTH